ncbi:MAG: hypothetical protein M1818_004517 [Claussenomyces sp. TS43310]|nr:MAG: hypothetical protein M1818_004517 [Claussenomyces sp. TS43310]
MSASADDQYEQQNDAVGGDIPTGDAGDDDYTLRQGQGSEPIAVQSDRAPVDDPIDPATADSDATLARDDQDAIDASNVIGGSRTRGAKPTTGRYAEPGDEEGLGGPDDGRSNTAGGPN